jgi:hypothetical protein
MYWPRVRAGDDHRGNLCHRAYTEVAPSSTPTEADVRRPVRLGSNYFVFPSLESYAMDKTLGSCGVEDFHSVKCDGFLGHASVSSGLMR